MKIVSAHILDSSNKVKEFLEFKGDAAVSEFIMMLQTDLETLL